MCGIVGLYARLPPRALSSGAMPGACSSRWATGAGQRGPRRLPRAAPAGSTKLSLHARDGAPDWGRASRPSRRRDPGLFHRVVGPSTRSSRSSRRRRGTARGRRRTPRGRGRCRRDDGRDHQGGDRPAAFVERFDVAAISGTPRARPHPHGDREPRHDRGRRTRSRPAWISASCTTARSRTTTACAASCAARASSSRPRTTPRSPPASWRGGMREGDTLERGLEGCLDDLDGFYTFLVGTADGLPCCAIRSPASRP